MGRLERLHHSGRAPGGAVFGQGAVPGAPGDGGQVPGRQAQGVQRIGGGAGNQDFLAGPEEAVQPGPIVGQDRHAAGRGLEQPSGRAPAHARHGIPRDVERDAGGTVERRVQRRRQVAHEIGVGRPGEPVRILRAPDDETLVRQGAGGFHEQPLQRRLPVGGVGAEIGQRPRILRPRRRRAVQRRIDGAVDRHDPARPQPVLQRVQRRAAGVAEPSRTGCAVHVRPCEQSAFRRIFRPDAVGPADGRPDAPGDGDIRAGWPSLSDKPAALASV